MTNAATAPTTASRPAAALWAAADLESAPPAVGAAAVAVAEAEAEAAEASTTAAPVGSVPLARPVATSWLPDATMVELKPLAVMTYVPPEVNVLPSSVKAVGMDRDEKFSVGVAIYRRPVGSAGSTSFSFLPWEIRGITSW